MIGKRRPQRELFDVGNVYDLSLAPGSFHAQLAVAAPRLFRDSDFAAFYSDRMGRPSVPPAQLALMTLLQHEAGCSDVEAVARTAFDLRWAAVLRRAAGEPLCAKSTFQLFRSHLVLHDEVRTIFTRSIEEAKRAGLLKGGALTIAVDTKPIIGRGAVEDTYNLLGTGIQQLVRALSSREGAKPAAWAETHQLGRHFGSSLKGSADIDWSDGEARNRFLTELVADARRVLELAGLAVAQADEKAAAKVREAAQLLAQLLLQDVVETPTEGGEMKAEIREGTARGRIPSATDPEQRHGRKSKSKLFNGNKAETATEVKSQIILDAEVIAGDAPDAQDVVKQVERVEENTGLPVGRTIGDCAYGSGGTRQEFAQTERELVAKVPQEPTNNGRFPKGAFLIDLENDAVTCPGGERTEEFTVESDGGKQFRFGAVCQECALRVHCTTAAGGRTLRVHPQEALLSAAREKQQTPEGRALLRERVVAEHRLARLAQLGIGQARYVGRSKTRFQLLIAATIANLRRVWNWEAAERQAPEAAVGDTGSAAASLPSAAAALRGPSSVAAVALRRAGGHLLPLAAWVLRRRLRPTVALLQVPVFAAGVSNVTCRPRF